MDHNETYETYPVIRHGFVKLCSPAKSIEYVEECDRNIDEDDQGKQRICEEMNYLLSIDLLQRLT